MSVATLVSNICTVETNGGKITLLYFNFTAF